MKGHPVRSLLLILMVLFIPLMPAQAASEAEARALVGRLEQEGVAMASSGLSMAEKQRRFHILLRSSFDLPSVARFILGRNWQTAPPDQRNEFVQLFEDITADIWVPRFRDYGGEHLQIAEVQPTGDGYLVETALLSRTRPQRRIAWRLRDTAQGLKVVDIVVDGVSMAVTHRSEYASVLRQTGNLAGLLDRMRQQVAQGPAH
jgi:phospholipid transport system substrate-binding protein